MAEPVTTVVAIATAVLVSAAAKFFAEIATWLVKSKKDTKITVKLDGKEIEISKDSSPQDIEAAIKNVMNENGDS